MMNYIDSDNLETKLRQWMKGISPLKREYEFSGDNAALLVIDCQNYFVEIPKPDGAPILPGINRLIGKFRGAGMPVIFTRHMHKSDMTDLGMLGEWWDECIIEGTNESELHESLGVQPDDIVIRKNRYNAFHGTDLEEILKENRIRDVVISGVMTNLCCETTARDAFVRDYRVWFVADATGTVSEEMHFASLMNLSFGFAHVVSTEEIAGRM